MAGWRRTGPEFQDWEGLSRMRLTPFFAKGSAGEVGVYLRGYPPHEGRERAGSVATWGDAHAWSDDLAPIGA
ncbi:hypothetical protein [Pikeienuella sp. HZG-20]|uniref:hypothetical protein n=1 Tax=Paludibacillus litoralis TaxID=3133267 RepID=UPI0030EBB850